MVVNSFETSLMAQNGTPLCRPNLAIELTQSVRRPCARGGGGGGKKSQKKKKKSPAKTRKRTRAGALKKAKKAWR